MCAAALLLIPLVVLGGSDAFRAALDFTTGVLSLVSLTASVVWGLVASDRLFLTVRRRLLAQAVHRATAVASIGFLLLHVTVKLALGHVSALGALLPFGLGVTGSAGLIGLGSLGGLLMVTTGVTGALRKTFASPARIASRWRALHMLAYPAWCCALLHGLYAGRQPQTYVVVLYCLCLVAVSGAVALRAAPGPVKREVAARVLALLDTGAGPGRGPRTKDVTPPPSYEPPARPTYAPRPATSSHGVGVGFSAAYRAVSAPIAPPPVTHEPHEHYEPPAPPAPPAPHERWPAPSPPPPAQAPPSPSAYDPTLDTPYGSTPGVQTGPAADTLPGPFQAPSAGEPWGAPPGGPQ
ncbi:hypothetical protein EOT10_29985 [Streptomyces antnestii]|uniref:Cytochrome b/b6 domain-containing protein n=1 Tax=Streptomyces antnestii TaxID=2494256 RepID=A0A3S2V9T7_9ACTN|nr:hypothetical protein EOT10_29985 [Streptomyces sp. San01]